ncbi:MAG: sigma-70 family RNA polymerase sigma factor [Lentisphaerae bacterium]|jgi:RNA polymerase sigma-70 factor (ECF subfamily)|nr:sigma-70 family RNA polymerase sigma factor [Lentisphaerota bacterium]
MSKLKNRDAEEARVRDAIRQVLDGDIEAFAVVVNTFEKLVAADLARRLPAQDVQEVAQDTFVRAWRALPSYRGDAPVRVWLLRIARYAAMDFWRQTYRRRGRFWEGLDDDAMTRMEMSHQEQVAAEKTDREARELARERLEGAMRQLSPDDRAVVTLVELEGATMREAAEQLDCSVSAVKVRAFRARKRLKNILLEMEAEKGKES